MKNDCEHFLPAKSKSRWSGFLPTFSCWIVLHSVVIAAISRGAIALASGGGAANWAFDWRDSLTWKVVLGLHS